MLNENAQDCGGGAWPSEISRGLDQESIHLLQVVALIWMALMAGFLGDVVEVEVVVAVGDKWS